MTTDVTEETPKPGLSREQRILSWIAVILVAGFLIDQLRDVLMPFVVGMAIAYFFDPVADKLEEMGFSRTLATSAILLGFFIALFGLALLLIPTLQKQITSAIQLIPLIVDRFRDALEPLLAQLSTEVDQDTVTSIREAVQKYAGTALKLVSGVISNVWSGGLAVLNILSLLLITPLVAFYLLRDWDRIVEKIDGLLPRDGAPTIRAQFRKIDATLAGFVRGQASVCLVLMVIYAVGLSFAGLNASLLVGIAAGALAVIPYIGAAISLIIGVALAVAQFHQDWVPILFVALVFITGQTLESYILTPRLVGGRVGLSPIWIIFAMLAGGSLFGLTGVLIALPVAAIAGVLVRFGIDQYLDSDLYRGDGEDSEKASRKN